jgi:formiminotetrahydrofolate cyclodeaminase
MPAWLLPGRRPGIDAVVPDLTPERHLYLLATAAERQARFQHLFVMEAHTFGRLFQAYSERGQSEADRQPRLAAIGEALVFATAVPMEVVQESRQLLELREAAARAAAPAVLADVVVSVRLAHAALEGAAANVRVALPSLNDRASVQRLEDELAIAYRTGAAQQQRILELIETRMPGRSALSRQPSGDGRHRPCWRG